MTASLERVCLGFLQVASVLALTACSTPEQSPPKNVCHPYYKANLTLDPTLDARNIPIAATGKIEAAQVGETAIQRYLSARFPSGELLLTGKLLAPYPQAIGFDIAWSLKLHIGERLSRAQIETLTEFGSCRAKRSSNADAEALTAGTAYESKLDAATDWIKALEISEAPENTLLQPSGAHDLALYKVKNYKNAAMWLFEVPIIMARQDQKSVPLFEAVGIWEQDSGHHMAVIRKFMLDRDGEILREEFLLMPSPAIKGVRALNSYYSMLWDKNDSFFDQRLMYNGLSGSTVKFLYREFSGFTNRSSFEQEVTYDLNIGEVIGFKSARFRILSATNTGIEYEVLEPFSKDGIYSTQMTY
tara:strand:- start:559 stop:1635 length:1077 start_codon:yes stop_codon:yes gene_type:complete